MVLSHDGDDTHRDSNHHHVYVYDAESHKEEGASSGFCDVLTLVEGKEEGDV